MKYIYKSLLSLCLIVFITGCNSSSDSQTTHESAVPVEKGGAVVSVTKLSTRSKKQVTNELKRLTTQVVANYDVDTYKVIYKTKNTKGDLINVSGLLAVPQKGTAALSPRMSIQHGTILLDKEAPSFNDQAYSATVIAASLGYIATEADYIGYGESAGQIHPHTQKDTLSGAAIDLLRASKTWLNKQNISDNEQLFLAGYSEGGYATLAVQKRIQEELSNEFTVTASVPAESAYDLIKTSEFKTTDAVKTFLFYGYIVKAYDETYGLNLLPEMIQKKYFDVVNTYYDGMHSSSEISALLPAKGSVVSNFFKKEFLDKFNNGQVPTLSQKLAENSIHDWTPTAPTRFYQGRDDKIVSFEPVAELVQSLKDKGAKNVELVECNAFGFPTTHANCTLPSMFYTVKFFSQYVHDL